MRSLAASLVALWFLAANATGTSRPSVILVTIDTLRADYLGAYGSTRGLTSALDQIASESVVFDEAFSAAPLTGPSLSSLLTSHYPHETGITNNGLTLPKGYVGLPSLLRNNGYYTAAVLSNFVLARPNDFSEGFDLYDCNFPQREIGRPALKERRADETTRRALEVLATAPRGQPVFLWVHYMDPHGPYAPPGERDRQAPASAKRRKKLLRVNPTDSGVGGIPAYQYIWGRRDPDDYRRRYGEEIAFLDIHLQKFFRGLQRLGLEHNTLLIVTADHGESLGEHNYYFAHGEYLFREVIHVPLFVRGPGLEPTRRGDKVGLIDLLPSVADYLGLDLSGPRRGEPIFRRPAPADRILIAETFPPASVTDRYAAIRALQTLIFSKPDTWEFYVNDDETQDRFADERAAARSLAVDLRRNLTRDDLAKFAKANPRRLLDEATIKTLRSLGYLN